MATSMRSTGTGALRHLSVIAFVVLIVVYLVVLQGLGAVLSIGQDIEYGAPTDIDEMWRTILVPVAVSVVLVYAVVAWLGWWRPVWVDDRPVQRWLIIVPVLMVLSVVAVTDYRSLADHGLVFTGLLLLGSLLVGLGEETMFRGIGVTCFRSNGFSEGKVALWSTLLFGLAHASNLFTEGSQALVQVGVTMVAGYFFYLIRRRTGGLMVPAIVHGLWDFSLISGYTNPEETSPLTFIAIATMIILAIVVIVRRHHIEPVTAMPRPDAE